MKINSHLYTYFMRSWATSRTLKVIVTHYKGEDAEFVVTFPEEVKVLSFNSKIIPFLLKYKDAEEAPAGEVMACLNDPGAVDVSLEKAACECIRRFVVDQHTIEDLV